MPHPVPPPHTATSELPPPAPDVLALIESLGLTFHLGNALMYIAYADREGAPVADLEMAVWYVQRAITLRRRGLR